MTNLTQHQKYYIYLNNIMKDTKVSLKEKLDLLDKAYDLDKLNDTEYHGLYTMAYHTYNTLNKVNA